MLFDLRCSIKNLISARRKAEVFMLKQNLSKIIGQRRNQTPLQHVVNKDGSKLPMLCGADFTET